jgi:protein TonB
MKANGLVSGFTVGLMLGLLTACAGPEPSIAGTPLTGEYISSFQATIKPVAVTKVTPEYPPRLQRMGVRGEVVVQFIVEVDGSVKEAEPVERSVGNGDQAEFEAAAVAALHQWRFQPGELQGQPVRVILRVPVGFGR